MKMKIIHYISCFHTNILHIKFSLIHVMKNIKISYQLVRRQETSYMIIYQKEYIQDYLIE